MAQAPSKSAEHLTAEQFEDYVLGENGLPGFVTLHDDAAQLQ